MATLRVTLLGMAIAAGLLAQTKVGGVCPLLTVDDAAAVLGAGTKAEPLVKSGPDMVCTFTASGKRLSLSAGGAGPMAAYYKTQIAKLKTEHKGKDETGLGEYAVSFVQDGDGAVIMAIKDGRMYDLKAFDAGTSPAVFEKLRALMRKAQSK